MTDSTTEFTAQEAVAVQRELRRSLGLPAETFPIEAFVGMISDEIERMREGGGGDAAVAEVIARVTGRTVSPETLATHYAPPEARRRG